MIRKQFHAFAMDDLDADDQQIAPAKPVVFFCNHPGWWDPIVAMQVCQHRYPDRVFYAPIDQIAIEKYSVFSKLGFFGVTLDQREGAIAFLKQTQSIMKASGSTLWITPEGRFSDARDVSASWMPGLAHLAKQYPDAVCIPMAIEYPFIHEAKPLMLCKIGKSIEASSLLSMSKNDCSSYLESQLRLTQKSLANSVMTRSFESFKVLVQASQTPKNLYDWCRWMMCKLTGRKFELNHGKNVLAS